MTCLVCLKLVLRYFLFCFYVPYLFTDVFFYVFKIFPSVERYSGKYASRALVLDAEATKMRYLVLEIVPYL